MALLCKALSLQSIKVETKDNKQFDTKLEYLKESVTIDDMITDLQATPTKLPLTTISSTQWNAIAPLLKLSYEIEKAQSNIEKGKATSALITFITNKSDDELKESFTTAFFLDIKNKAVNNALNEAIKNKLISAKKVNEFLKSNNPSEYNPFNLASDIAKIIAQRITQQYAISKLPIIKAIRKTATPEKEEDWQYFDVIGYNTDGKAIATGNYEGTINIWSTSGKQSTALAKIGQKENGHSDAIFAIKFNPQGTLLASGSQDATIKLWDVSNLKSPKLLTTINEKDYKGHSDTVTSLAFSNDGKTLYSGSLDETVKIWNISNAQKPSLTGTMDAKEKVYSFVVNEKRNILICACLSMGMEPSSGPRVWNISNPTSPSLITRIKAGDSTNAVALSKDGNILVVGPGEPLDPNTERPKTFAAEIFNIRNLKNPVKLSSIEIKEPSQQYEISPDGRILAFTTLDESSKTAVPQNKLELWNIANIENPIQVGTIKNVGVTSTGVETQTFDFSPDGNFIATLTENGIQIVLLHADTLKDITLPQALLLYYAALQSGGINVNNESQGIQKIYNGFSNEIKNYLKPLIRQ